MRLAPLAVLLLASAALQAQPVPGTCTPGRAEAALRLTRLEASVFNTGSLFFGGSTTGGYLVPRGTRKSPIFAAGLYLGGTVGGQPRVAAARYSDVHFWPGPLGPDARPVNPADCSPYDRIYSVTRQDVQDFLRTGVATADLRDWPAALGAPVLDGDGVAGNYDLAAGDQPALRGDAVSWWLMNDVGNNHLSTNTPPLGVEVRVEAYGFDSLPLAETTFYRYTVTNRTSEPIEQMYAAMFADPDLGNQTDDYVGTDTTTGMAYAYNADDDDEGGIGYGAAPPAFGVQFASGPVGLPNGRDDDHDGTIDEPGERLGMTASSYFIGGPDGAMGVPTLGTQIYRHMQGLWNDGSPKRTFGSGYGQTRGAVTPFMYPGDPVAGEAWSESNNGTASPQNPRGDRLMVASMGAFRLGPGESETFTVAMPYARGASNLDSVRRLRLLASDIRALFASGESETQPVGNALLPEPLQTIQFGRPSPNPFSDRATVRYEMPAGTPLRATLHDVLGRRLAVLHDGPTEANEGEIAVDGAGLAAGVYQVRVTVPGAGRVVTLVRR